MKKAKNALLISIFSLVFAVAIATTSTLAWFAMSDDPTVEAFEMTVTTNENLYISASADSGFAFDLKYSDLSFGNIKLDACTPSSADSTMVLKKMDGKTAAESTYYDFTLYFLAGTATSVALDYNIIAITTEDPSARTVAAPTSISADDVNKGQGTTDASDKIEGDPIDARAANAARIAFISGTNAIIYNPNSDKGWSTVTTANKTNMAKLVYDYQAGTDITIGEEVTTTAGPLKGYSNAIVTLTKVDIPNTNLTTEETNLTTEAGRLGLDTGSLYTGSIRVLIWLEGKDADCFNSIYADTLSVKLGFHAPAVTA